MHVGIEKPAWMVLLFAAGLFGPAACAQYPEKPITLVTPFAAGGSSDLNARVFTRFLTDYLGQPVLIKLVPGQAGQKGTLEAVQAPPDGYTLLLTDNYRDQLHQHTFRNDAYDTNRDLVPVARVNYGQVAIIVRSDSPYETWAQLEADARARPGEITFSHSGLWVAFFVPGLQIMKNSVCRAGTRHRVAPLRLRRKPGTCSLRWRWPIRRSRRGARQESSAAQRWCPGR